MSSSTPAKAGNDKQPAPHIARAMENLKRSVEEPFVDPKAPPVLKVGNVELEYVASAKHYDPRRVTDYYIPGGQPRIVEARVYNESTGVFERRALGVRTFTSKTRLR